MSNFADSGSLRPGAAPFNFCLVIASEARQASGIHWRPRTLRERCAQVRRLDCRASLAMTDG